MPKPKNTVTKSQLIAQLKRAKAETAQLRRQTRDCRCAPMTQRTRDEKIEEICKMVSHFHPEDFDFEKLRARKDRLEHNAGAGVEDTPHQPTKKPAYVSIDGSKS